MRSVADQKFPVYANSRVLIIEDSKDTRGIIKSQLVPFKFATVDTLENGTPLLLDKQPLDYDIIVLGQELGNCHSGVELLQAFDQYQMLPIWTKIIFITNDMAGVAATHPFRYLHCDLMPKPFKPNQLLHLVNQGILSVKCFRRVLEQLDKGKLSSLEIALEQIPTGQLSSLQQDELVLIKTRVLLKQAQGERAWELSNQISNETSRVLNKIAIADALGDGRKLQLITKMHTKNDAMAKRCLFSQMQQWLSNSEFAEALKGINQFTTASLSLDEVELKALLLCEVQGYRQAIDFLQRKRNISLENQYFRNRVSLAMVKVYLYQMLRHKSQPLPRLYGELSALISGEPWDKGEFDFSGLMPFIVAATDTLMPNVSISQTLISQCLEQLDNQHFLQITLLLLAMGHYEQKEKGEFERLLLLADKLISDGQVSAAHTVNGMLFDAVIAYLFDQNNKTRYYNKLGMYHRAEDEPYQALRLFYQSHLCQPSHPAVAINLLDTLITLGLTTYWQISAQGLIDRIHNLPLKPKEAEKFASLVASISQRQ